MKSQCEHLNWLWEKGRGREIRWKKEETKESFLEKMMLKLRLKGKQKPVWFKNG